jgi:Chaperone of endosialidase
VAAGDRALLGNTTGSNNIALGFAAGEALTTGSNNIDIGNAGVAAETNTIRIGTQGTQTATFMAGISGTALAGGVVVRVNANGQLGTVGSAARFKQNIKPMDKASEAIHALKPVTFRYKQELDPEGTPQFGLVAEQVEKINPDLVARDEQGKPYTVRYEAVNAMLLNEFLKEHRKVEQLETKVTRQETDFQTALTEQQKEIEALTASLKEQAAQIQKVSAQLEANKRTPQLVAAKQ